MGETGVVRKGLRGLPPGQVVAEQRRRILAAVPEAIAEQGGYERTAVRHVIDRAGVSRRTFYELFRGREDAFRTAYDESFERFHEAIARAYAAGGCWSEKIAAAMRTALMHGVPDPAVARMILIEPLCAGSALASHHHRSFERFVPFLLEGRGQGPRESGQPASLERALLGAVCGVAAGRLHRDEAASLPSLGPELTEFLLAPYLSSECETD